MILFNKPSKKSKTLIAAAAAAAMGLGLAGNAQAAAIADASLQLNNFTFTLGGTITPQENARNTQGTSTFNGTDPTYTDPQTSPTTSDAAQSTAGPGPFPGGNTFSWLAGTALGMQGGRGDALTYTTPPTFTRNVSEARLDGIETHASGSSYNKNGFTLTVNKDQGDTGAFQMSFDGYYRRYARTDVAGEGARAATTMSFTIENLLTGTIYDISDDLTLAPILAEFNRSCTRSGNEPDCQQEMTTGVVDLTDTYFKPVTWNVALPTGSYNFSLNVTSSVDVDGVPEPASLALLGTGLVGMVGARRRKAKAQS